MYFKALSCWLAINDLQPTAPVLKAGHPVSCSSLCVYVVCCIHLVCIVWFLEVRFLGFFIFFLLLLSKCAIYTHVFRCIISLIKVVNHVLLDCSWTTTKDLGDLHK